MKCAFRSVTGLNSIWIWLSFLNGVTSEQSPVEDINSTLPIPQNHPKCSHIFQLLVSVSKGAFTWEVQKNKPYCLWQAGNWHPRNCLQLLIFYMLVHKCPSSLTPGVGWFWSLCFSPLPWVSHGFHFSCLVICPSMAPFPESVPYSCFLHFSNELLALKSLFFKNSS